MGESILIVGGYGVVGSRIAADLASDYSQHCPGRHAEGLRVSLDGARAKLAQMDQITARRQVGLGIPSFPDVAARTLAGTRAP